MKVILIKDCKDGKANTIIDVAAGYGTNFLIKKGFAVAYNPTNLKLLEKRLDELSANEHEHRSEARELKEKLEQERLSFTLEATIDKNGHLNVHGSVSRKDIEKTLVEKGYKLPKHAIQKVDFVAEGLHEVKAELYKDIVAKIYVDIKIHQIKK
ncbi:50S ribosomal protein L9 [Mycoplasmopsis gallinacea]|uniref:Large ribosomal subunit protein bL9 n=1 Tax=Mycoplasmopsis gallinacea TaxID=29556 RepID=A0A6H0V298_9BACT|nr:50S ribosomal protein L9 [Mycoplasmopsis gallinacea]QIW62470.1 50S ribosomal protein L9 [Mycoplasmopsis gallinacea]